MKRRIAIIFLVTFFVISLLNVMDTKRISKETVDETDFILDISEIQSDIYVNKGIIKRAVKRYIQDEKIKCQTATAIDYKYEDLDTADVVYDIYFLLDNEENTLLKVCYKSIQNSPEAKIKVMPCEYTYGEIESKVWHKEDYQ